MQEFAFNHQTSTSALLAAAIVALLAAGAAGQENERLRVVVERLPENPLISYASSASLGNKINGPSVIRVPGWIEKPLGEYYLYFAHHKGKYIRLAYADAIRGPWTVYEPGTLHVDQASALEGHVASPDVHVDEEARVIRMYFHGSRPNENQKTCVATSTDGLRFTASPAILGEAYFRVFRWQESCYAIDAFGDLYRSERPEQDWVKRDKPLISPTSVDDQFGLRNDVRLRHSAVWVRGDVLYIFFTRKADAPERIFVSRLPLEGDWNSWAAETPVEVMRPQMTYEGIDYALAPSKKGGAIEVQQLRDPYLFEDDGQLYLFYSVAGEMGIAAARIEILDDRVPHRACVSE